MKHWSGSEAQCECKACCHKATETVFALKDVIHSLGLSVSLAASHLYQCAFFTAFPAHACAHDTSFASYANPNWYHT